MTMILIKARRNTGKLSFPGSLVGFSSWCSRLASSSATALGTMGLGGTFLGSSLWDCAIQQSVQDIFFFQIFCIF